MKAKNFILNIFQDLNLQTKKIFKVQDNSNVHFLKPLIKYDNEKHFNVVGIHNAEGVKGKSLILNGHIDVVPIEVKSCGQAHHLRQLLKGTGFLVGAHVIWKAGLAS